VLDGVMGEVITQLEGMVRRYPWQWFQFAPFWPELGVLEDAQAARAAKLGVE
jgi:predicted LPLAT superfamily acyltransferase